MLRVLTERARQAGDRQQPSLVHVSHVAEAFLHLYPNDNVAV
jgi:hypothetical protein